MNAVAGALRFAWHLVSAAARHVFVLSRQPALEPGHIHAGDDADALVVLLHGIRQSRRSWCAKLVPYLAAVRAGAPRADVYAPFFQQHYRGTVAQFAAPVLEEIERWRAAHEGCRVVLVGFSNGGRVAAWLESRLPGSVTVLTVAAPMRGTALLRLVPRWLAALHLGAAAASEMRLGCALWPINPAVYHACGSPGDWTVYPLENTHLPDRPVYTLPPLYHADALVCPEALAWISSELAK